MWFKQIQLFQLADALRFSVEDVQAKLELLTFNPCLPSMSHSIGWVSPVEEEDISLIQVMSGNYMICLQIEEKILPAIVIRQEVVKKIKQIETVENRKVSQKEKLSLKDELIMTLLPRAFSKITRVYAYIDTKNHWLVLGTTNKKHTEQFLSLFKKSISQNIHAFQLKKLSTVMTYWVTQKEPSQLFSIEKAGVLQDPKQQNRIIRCQQQDLFANGIQTLIKDGCEVKQLAIAWQDRMDFVLADDFSLHSIKFQDQIIMQAKEMEAETKEQRFKADFFIMGETLNALFKDLLSLLMEPQQKIEQNTIA